MKRPFLRVASACAATGAALLLTIPFTPAASAHVSATASAAPQGGNGVITLTVPTEKETAATVEIVVTLPAAMKTARALAIPGWISSVQKNANLEPTSITWRAAPGNAGIRADEFGTFTLRVGPLPHTDTASFPTTQVYSDGSRVAWDQPAPADGQEAEHPVPTVALTAAAPGGDHGHGAAAPSTPAAEPAAPVATEQQAGSSDGTARVLAGLGIVVGLAGLGAAVAFSRKSRAQ